MRKILAIGFIIAGVVISCQKEDIKPTKPISAIENNCSCGVIISDDVEDYSIVIRNECSKNDKKFILSAEKWINAHPGKDYCMLSAGTW